ncbi:endonuclease dU [Candidatus Nitrosocosmicus sp. T]
MCRDLIIDGMVFGNVTIEGNDSTQNILSMYRSLNRNDINCIMLDGLIISMYNIIDGNELEENTNVPVIAITFNDSEGLEGTIRHHFSNDFNLKLEQYRKLGRRDKILLKTGKILFVRYWGMSSMEASTIVNYFTLQGSIPEPIRIAKLDARANMRSK